jgi:acyl-coenzyme A thioesterase PaaI-like protein
MKASTLRRSMNLWPPLLFSGIRITRMHGDFRHVTVELRDRWFNRNYVGTHFGGAIFAMTDPFWMIMVMRNLGRDFTVWDKSGTIEFLKPGTGTLRADFTLTEAMLNDIRANMPNDGDKHVPTYCVDIVNKTGETVARVTKTLHIRKKADTRGRIGG